MITVVKPGLLTTVQDSGRWGFQHYGVIVAGAMDPLALRLGNVLLGNRQDQAGLEMTMQGPVLRFESEQWFVLTGAAFKALLGDKRVPFYQVTLAKKGETLSIKSCPHGCRSYLAVGGGLALPSLMGSASTYLRAGIGGFHGRALRTGDRLKVLPHRPRRLLRTVPRGLLQPLLAFYKPRQSPVRVSKGPQWHWFTAQSQRALLHDVYRVSTHSDRMGYRLEGGSLRLRHPQQLLSEAVAFGSIQVSAGAPILLLADRQTTGGYPKIAQVISVDLSRVAQFRPGESIHFGMVSLRRAERLLWQRESWLQALANFVNNDHFELA